MVPPNRRKRETAKDKVLAELNGLVGLKEVKEQFNSIESCVRICCLQGTNPRTERWHAVFQGNPGTGNLQAFPSSMRIRYLHFLGRKNHRCQTVRKILTMYGYREIQNV